MDRLIYMDRLRYIKSIGAEFEGGICDDNYEKLLDSLEVFLPKLYSRLDTGSDGSVRVPLECGRPIRNIEIRVWSEKPADLAAFARLLWSFGFKQNETCGNHMHIRFKNVFYINVFTFYDAVAEFIDAYSSRFTGKKYRDRLYGRFSRAQRSQSDILDNYKGYRYYAVNLAAFTKPTKTLEIRIMPYADNAEEWIEMMKFNIETVEKIVDKFRSRFAYEFDIANMARDIMNNIHARPKNLDRIDRVYEIELAKIESPPQYAPPDPPDPNDDPDDIDNASVEESSEEYYEEEYDNEDEDYEEDENDIDGML